MKRYHAELRRAYQMIFENLNENLNIESTINKEIILQMIVKAINDTVDSDELMLILLIFETYSRMHVMNFSISSITQCYAPVLSTSTSHLVTSSPLSIKQACLTVLIILQSIESFDSLIMLRFSASELKNEQEISDESFTERFTKRFISWYSHHDLKTT